VALKKTFEIGRQFRNEGISPEHLQDYTQMEFYWAYANYNDTMELVERMYKQVVQATFGTMQFKIKEFDVDFSKEWPKLDYVTAIQDQLGIHVLNASEAELKAKCDALGIKVDGQLERGRLTDLLWKQCRKTIAGPVFLINHPVAVSPLAKRMADHPELVERYQVIIAGSELGNGYTELNDPIDQAGRFEGQAKMRQAGDEEAQMHDQDFVEALEYGMPPTSGFGVSERLFSFLMNKPIRECVMFPLLRPKHSSDSVVAVAAANQATGDDSLKPFEPGITRAAALAWMEQEVPDAHLRRHMLATEIIMQKFAEHYGAANPEAWGIAGLLHDIDYTQVPMEQHSLVGAEWLEKKGLHPLVVAAVREHNGKNHKLEPQSLMSKVMYCFEQTTGLIMAATAVRPDKDVRNVELKSLVKKFKDKAFAKAVERDITSRAPELLNLSVEDGLKICLEAMQAAYDRY
jgi:lysyl-tRNA synthetase class 2